MDRDQMARIALRYDTVVSHAMLRALGVPIPQRKPKRPKVDRYKGARKAFKVDRYGRSALR